MDGYLLLPQTTLNTFGPLNSGSYQSLPPIEIAQNSGFWTRCVLAAFCWTVVFGRSLLVCSPGPKPPIVDGGVEFVNSADKQGRVKQEAGAHGISQINGSIHYPYSGEKRNTGRTDECGAPIRNQGYERTRCAVLLEHPYVEVIQSDLVLQQRMRKSSAETRHQPASGVSPGRRTFPTLSSREQYFKWGGVTPIYTMDCAVKLVWCNHP